MKKIQLSKKKVGLIVILFLFLVGGEGAGLQVGVDGSFTRKRTFRTKKKRNPEMKDSSFLLGSVCRENPPAVLFGFKRSVCFAKG